MPNFTITMTKRQMQVIHSTGVKMQTSSVYKTNSQSQKLKNYIYKL